ncbi:aminotransferase class III-fold pyridoxal phosphate-dependent enzyme [Marinilabiliaceae bacterium ANBcel2]|nr:aminotransferase class III-fold pyridoxal phosphate-dependent enzyme [Marinilabiliaceae bacterium ANBcel2]
MDLFDVYPLMDTTPVKAKDCYVWDDKNNKYLDLYGGHAVISIGHSHPEYVNKITKQLSKIGFYSNSIQNPLQKELASKLGEMCGLTEYKLFLCNSGAEANENALKLASFHTKKDRILTFNKAFHGRTSVAVAATDNPKIQSKINTHNVTFINLNDSEAVEKELEKGDVCAVIIEGVQGIGGVRIPQKKFLTNLSYLCKKYNSLLILDEIQSGYGRTGSFFAYEDSNIKPDIITVAKGMGNGFPVGAVLISPQFKPAHGMLGTTFGGNYLACAASIAVLDVIKKENLIKNAKEIGDYLINELVKNKKIKEVRGKGLMIGIEMDYPVAELRKKLREDKKIFTGVSSTNIVRVLPPLTLSKEMANYFIESFNSIT